MAKHLTYGYIYVLKTERKWKSILETVNFEQLEISEPILRAVTEMGFEEASPIQAKAIPAQMEGLDIIGQAQTGTGKTAAFGIPLL